MSHDINQFINTIIEGNAFEKLKLLPAGSARCCVTSPPYYGLRDYGTAAWIGGDNECDHLPNKECSRSTLEGGKSTQQSAKFYRDNCVKCGATREDQQIGLEETPEQYVEKLVTIFREVKRILTNDGTLWLNLGDSYAASGGKQVEQTVRGNKNYVNAGQNNGQRSSKNNPVGIKPKDLIGIPWMAAFALRADGWYLRQDIIWHKPNPMPESVTDRCTKSHEYIFLMSKSAKYYYDADPIREEIKLTDGDTVRFRERKTNNPFGDRNGDTQQREVKYEEIKGANKRSVWTVTTKPFSEAHFATFPEDLIVDCIKAGCPEFVCNKCGKARERIISIQAINRTRTNGTNAATEEGTKGRAGETISQTIGYTDCGCGAGFSPGIVLDPFMGAGTTAMVARKLNRNYMGVELNPEYIAIANKRLKAELGLFL